jgi:hypothetical protein
MVDVEDRPVFVAGAARSGTTMMVWLLRAHPRIHNSGESGFYTRLDRQFPGWETAPPPVEAVWDALAAATCDELGVDMMAARARFDARCDDDPRAVFEAILQVAAIEHGKPRWGDKTPGNFKVVDRHLRRHAGARVIWMVRDPRAVVASHKHVAWNRRSFAAQAVGARSSLRKARPWLEDPRVLVVQYESLVARPEAGLRRVFEFLDEPFDPAILQDSNVARLKTFHSSYRDAGGVAGDPIRRDTVDRWREALTPGEVAYIEFSSRKEMRDWGYRPVSSWPARLVAGTRAASDDVRRYLRRRRGGRISRRR